MKSFLIILLVAVSSSVSLPTPPKPSESECSNFKDEERFDCFPDAGPNQEGCEARGCCWIPNELEPKAVVFGVPWCFFPKGYSGYKVVNITSTLKGESAILQQQFSSPFPRDVENVAIDFEHQTENRLRVKIYDPANARFEAPYPKINSNIKQAVERANYEVAVDFNQQGFAIKRKDGEEIFNSNVGAFIFSDLVLQITTTFNGTIYGLAEHRAPLAIDPKWTRLTLFNSGKHPIENANLYGSHPFYLVIGEDGQSYGVFLHNSNAMDVLLQPLNALTFRPIGGILDFYFFMGPTPREVLQQYTELIGRPFLPPYWSLGFQLCRYGYDSLEKTRATWQRNRDAEIPFDVQWNDIDYMLNRNDFTIDPVAYAGLTDFVKEVHDAGMHYVPILDPGVSASEPNGTYPPYSDGVDMDIFVKDKDGKIYVGKVWNPESTVFPDFTNPKTQEYWTKQVKSLYKNIAFDGIWIDMNEPNNFYDGFPEGCPDDELERPPVIPAVDNDNLASQTLCMTARHYAGIHYDVHNLYGISEAEMTQKALRETTGKRGFILSRSTFAGSGAYTGHWSGDDFTTWYDLQHSVREILSANLVGIPLAGADICGFVGDTTISLCNRWVQLGAFYPFSRNHNDYGYKEQDPAFMGQEIIDSAKKALNIRYTLLPYLYTLFYRARVYGDTVARPLFVEFPEDPATHQIDSSFLWGSGLYIIPVLEENATSVRAYVPKGRWYDWYTLGGWNLAKGQNYDFDAPLDQINLLIRGGVVIPTQAPAVTTTLSRKNGFTLIAAGDENNTASGTLFWDDGDSIDTIENQNFGLLTFTLDGQTFSSKVEQWNTTDTPQLENIKILGVSKVVNQVSVNNKSADFSYTANNGVLTVNNINLPLNVEVEVVWS